MVRKCPVLYVTMTHSGHLSLWYHADLNLHFSANASKNEVGAYQEPADALGIIPSAQQMYALNTKEQRNLDTLQADAYQEPADALRPSLELEQK